jgi:hypothetical protein
MSAGSDATVPARAISGLDRLAGWVGSGYVSVGALAKLADEVGKIESDLSGGESGFLG